jgi:hypothetical protein
MSLRDTFQVGRFHLIRAVRTWTVVFLCAVYMLGAGGVAWSFRGLIGKLEQSAAELLRVPVTDTPGAMVEILRGREELQSIMSGLIPDDTLLDWALSLPVLTIPHFWMALVLLPFIAAVIGAEVISPGIRDRSLRYELVRTGRLELMLGRWAGQCVLIGLGTTLSVLLGMTPPLIAWSLPFLGLGVACSQSTANTNFARLFALFGTVSTWIAFGVFQTDWMVRKAPWLVDILEPLLPQSYIESLWGPGLVWVLPSVILLGLGIGFALLGFPLFARRNL